MTLPQPTPAAWRSVDAYLTAMLVGDDPSLTAAISGQKAAGMPAIEVVPLTGKLLHLLVRMSAARRVLEIGTLGGYSTIWLARAVPEGGRVVTIEAETEHARVARTNVDRAGIGDRVDIRVGVAAEVLATLDGEEPFDLVFIDADKQSNTIYLDWAARLARPGTVVVVDNIGRAGRVADAGATEADVVGTQEALRMLRDDSRFDATAIQTLDAKGWDGLAIAIIQP